MPFACVAALTVQQPPLVVDYKFAKGNNKEYGCRRSYWLIAFRFTDTARGVGLIVYFVWRGLFLQERFD